MYHDEITRDALDFLRPEILKQISDGNLYQDSNNVDINFGIGRLQLFGPAWDSYSHFDKCEFYGSSKRINDYYTNVLKSGDPLGAAWTFGKLLHPVQDFYAHSNWVELGQKKIVDDGLSFWRLIRSWKVLTGNIVAIQEPKPSGWSVADTPTGYSPVPKVTDAQGNMYRGLFTHSHGAGDDCPTAVESWKHDQLNKDAPTRRDYAGHMNIHPYTEMHNRAVALAVDQTEQEWCRYLNLLKSRYGYESVSIPMALWVDEDKSPHPEGTPCQPSELGDKSLTVMISNIKIINDLDDGSNPGDYKLVFALYTGDLKRSVRTQTTIVEGESGRLWPSDKLPQSLTMCLKPTDTLVATVQGWDEENVGNLRGVLNQAIYEGDYLVADADQVIRGVTGAVLGPDFGQGIHTLTSDNIEVTFKISQMFSGCLPEGTTSASVDIDKDGVVNEQDNCMDNPNRDQKDTDNDGKGDACDPDLVDYEKDGVADSKDNCWYLRNPDQKDSDGDGIGDVCDLDVVDRDKDGLVDSKDNCSTIANPDQKDTNGDGSGDACQMGDGDTDGLADYIDNCPRTVNPDQNGTDGDKIGDACEIGPGTIF